MAGAWRKPVASQSDNRPQIIQQSNIQANNSLNNQWHNQQNNQSNYQPGNRFWNASNNGPQIIEQSNIQSNNQWNNQQSNQSNYQPGNRFWNSSNNQRNDRFPPSNGQPNNPFNQSNYPTINQSNELSFQQSNQPRQQKPPRQWSNVVRKPNDYNRPNNQSNNQTVHPAVISSAQIPINQPSIATINQSVRSDSLLMWLCVGPQGEIIVRIIPDSLKRATDQLHPDWVDDYKKKFKSLSNQASNQSKKVKSQSNQASDQSPDISQPADDLLEHLSDNLPINQVHHHLDRDCQCSYFASSLTCHMPTLESANAREYIVECINQCVIRALSNRRVTVSRAGSNATNTNFAHSDIDLTIKDLSNNPPLDREKRSALRIVSDRFLREFPYGSVEGVLHKHARIPLIRMVVPLRELPFVDHSTGKQVSREQFNAKAIAMLAPSDRCSVDLKWQDALDASKTSLLIEFLACDPRVRPAFLTVKWIAQAREINDARQQTFNSYSLMLMFIFVMQRVVQPPVLPVWDELDLKMIAPEQSPLRGSLAMSWQERLSTSQINTMSVNALVGSFFRFFATQFRPQYDAVDVVRGLQQRALCVARNGRYEVVPSMSGCDADPRAAFVVVDPYTKDDNGSRAVTHLALPRIIAEFRRAHRILSQARSSGQSCCSNEIWAQLTERPTKKKTTERPTKKKNK